MRSIQKLKQRAEGFTIIEVMIVLAIAGLILLIVFLAVPALQRNAHNTSIKNDVSSLLGGVNEYVNNNNGDVPTGLTNLTTTSVDITGGAGTNNVTSKVGYIDGTTGVTLQKATGAVTNTLTAGQVAIYTNAICNGNNATNVGATSRNFVAIYALEGGAKECQAS